MENLIIHYIFLSYILHPFLMALRLYVQDRNYLDESEERDSYWVWLKDVLSDFYIGSGLVIYLFSPIMLFVEIFDIIKYLRK